MKVFSILMKQIVGGRHKSYQKCSEDEKEYYQDVTEEKLHEWALAEAMSDF